VGSRQQTSANEAHNARSIVDFVVITSAKVYYVFAFVCHTYHPFKIHQNSSTYIW